MGGAGRKVRAGARCTALRRAMIVGVVLLGAVLLHGADGDEGRVPPELVRSDAAAHRDPDSVEPAWADGLAKSDRATVTCRFEQVADRVQVVADGDGPRMVRARGSWRNGTCPPGQAVVTVQLQAKQEGSWRDVGNPGVARVSSHRAGSAAATDGQECEGRGWTQWRSVTDVDLVGHSDDPDPLISPAVRLACRPSQ